jgi:hypothetical protein
MGSSRFIFTPLVIFNGVIIAQGFNFFCELIYDERIINKMA